jgi:hypothetical protein
MVVGVCGFASAHAVEMRAKCDNGLMLNATVDPVAKPMPTGAKSRSRLDGSLKVVNATAVGIGYSNRFAVLSGARAYVDSVASQAMDFGLIQIEAGRQIETQVYWPSTVKPGTIATNLALDCKVSNE